MSNAVPREFRGYPVMERRFAIGEQQYELLGPANFEELIDDPRVVSRFERDEYLPYWAEFWPACLLLCDEIAAWPPASVDRPAAVLEFGCGLGLPSLVAASRGYRVIASDYDEDALAFVALSFARNGLPAPELRFVDWRETYPGLVLDAIVAAEVLYERRSVEPIARFIAGHLAPHGVALLVDGRRQTADAFPRQAAACGLRVEASERERPGPDGRPIRGRVFRVTKSCEVPI